MRVLTRHKGSPSKIIYGFVSIRGGGVPQKSAICFPGSKLRTRRKGGGKYPYKICKYLWQKIRKIDFEGLPLRVLKFKDHVNVELLHLGKLNFKSVFICPPSMQIKLTLQMWWSGGDVKDLILRKLTVLSNSLVTSHHANMCITHKGDDEDE